MNARHSYTQMPHVLINYLFFSLEEDFYSYLTEWPVFADSKIFSRTPRTRLT